jgi:hypothetical protein
MKTVTILRFLTAVGSTLSAVAALDLSGVANLFEPGVSQYLLAAGPAALALKELVVVLGDIFDDGKPNKSFKLGLFALALALLMVPLLGSCARPLPISGEFKSDKGTLFVHPNGRVEIIVEPQTSK